MASSYISRMAITNDLAVVLGQPSQMAITNDLPSVFCLVSRMAITNDLAVVLGQPSQMASCFTSSSIRL